MTFLQFAASLVLLVLLVAGGLTLMYARKRRRAPNAGLPRTQIARAFESERIARMIRHRWQIDADTYTHFVPLGEAQAQLEACRGCRHLAACEAALAAPVPGGDFSFCPNAAALASAAGEIETTLADATHKAIARTQLPPNRRP